MLVILILSFCAINVSSAVCQTMNNCPSPLFQTGHGRNVADRLDAQGLSRATNLPGYNNRLPRKFMPPPPPPCLICTKISRGRVFSRVQLTLLETRPKHHGRSCLEVINVSLVSNENDVFRPSIVGMRESIVVRLQPRILLRAPSPTTTPACDTPMFGLF